MITRYKFNKQDIKNIICIRQVWGQEVSSEETELYYYHIIDVLNRKWQTIGYNVSDAIRVFQNGCDDKWTYIIEQAPYNPDLTTNDLINMLSITSDASDTRNAIQIILNTVERRNAFVNRMVNVNEESTLVLLGAMQEQYLTYNQLSDKEFMKLYTANPVNALTVYFLEPVDIIAFWEWETAGGTCEKAIQYKLEKPLMTLIQAIERAEDETSLSFL
ncbi:hypothetical protein ACWHAM_03395 [Paenibacillus terrae]